MVKGRTKSGGSHFRSRENPRGLPKNGHSGPPSGPGPVGLRPDLGAALQIRTPGNSVARGLGAHFEKHSSDSDKRAITLIESAYRWFSMTWLGSGSNAGSHCVGTETDVSI